MQFRSLFKEISKFLISGGISFLITLATLNFLLYLDASLFTASIIGYGGGIISSFILNKKWTFQFTGNKTNTVNLFIIFVLFNIMMMIFFGYLNLWFFIITKHVFIGQILSLSITTALNYIVYKSLIFRKCH